MTTRRPSSCWWISSESETASLLCDGRRLHTGTEYDFLTKRGSLEDDGVGGKSGMTTHSSSNRTCGER